MYPQASSPDESSVFEKLCASCDVGFSVVHGVWEKAHKALARGYPGSNAWTVRVTCGSGSMSFPLFTSKKNVMPPTADTVFFMLFVISESYATFDMDGWAREFGFDPSAVHTRRVYNNARTISTELKEVLGSKYDLFHSASRF